MCSVTVVRRPRAPPSRWQATRSPLVEQLDGALGDARIDLLTQQAMRHRVVMAVDVDVIVERDAALAPLGVNVGLDRQGGERRPVEFVEQLAPADAEAAHRPAVEIAEQRGDREVQLGQREEALVAQASQDPALDHLHADLDLGLVARSGAAGPGGSPCRSGWRSPGRSAFSPGSCQLALSTPALRLSGTIWRHAAEERQRTHVRADPVGQRLASRSPRRRCSSTRPARRRSADEDRAVRGFVGDHGVLQAPCAPR